MNRRLFFVAAAAFAAMLGSGAGAQAAEPMKVSGSFSILGDMVKQVGGDRVEVFTFVGPNSDAHVYESTLPMPKNCPNRRSCSSTASVLRAG